MTSRRILRSLCAEVGPEDGLDPRLTSRVGEGRKGDRKARQLCGQAAEALSLALAQSGDPVLQGLVVVAVEPAPDASRLLATIATPPTGEVEPGEALVHLERASGRLRTEVAAAITRRKSPGLAFRVAVPGAR